jgi:hypothetical protein
MATPSMSEPTQEGKRKRDDGADNDDDHVQPSKRTKCGRCVTVVEFDECLGRHVFTHLHDLNEATYNLLVASNNSRLDVITFQGVDMSVGDVLDYLCDGDKCEDESTHEHLVKQGIQQDIIPAIRWDTDNSCMETQPDHVKADMVKTVFLDC